MTIKFNADEVLPMLAQCVSIVNTKNSLPILSDILFETKLDGNNSGFMLTASDSETWLQVYAPILSFDGDSRFCINASDFYKALLNLKGKQIEMVIDESTHVVTCKHGKGHFQLPYEDATEYPLPTSIDDDNGTITKILDGSRVLRSLEKAGFAVANDELRPIMNGVHFDFLANMMVTVATDGHKLAKYSDYTIEQSDMTPIGFTLPKKPATTLMNILCGYDGNIKVAITFGAIVVNNKDFKMTTRLIEGRYPNYDSVIPKDNNIVVDVHKNDFISALKRVLPMSNTSSELVSLKLSMGTITLEAIDVDFSKSASENIECDYCGVEFAIGFKGSAMLQVAQNIEGDNIKIALKEPSRAGVFSPSKDTETTQFVSLLMPMLIQND